MIRELAISFYILVVAINKDKFKDPKLLVAVLILHIFGIVTPRSSWKFPEQDSKSYGFAGATEQSLGELIVLPARSLLPFPVLTLHITKTKALVGVTRKRHYLF